jgi:hypothetical protein
MSHPFEVGKTYRNRNGDYVVQAIDGDRMTIRYVGGATLETSASIQARIWENIQFEKQLEREEERRRLAREARLAARRRSAQARRARAKPKFEGFEESDFEIKTRGIAWSDRRQLGKRIAYELRERKKGDFAHWIVPRQPRINVARKDYFERDQRQEKAAYYVAVDEHGVEYGLRIPKPKGKPEDEWQWSLFLDALEENEEIRGAMRTVMENYELDLDVYAMEVSYEQVGRITIQEDLFVWEREDAEEESSHKMSSEELIEYLRTVADEGPSEIFVRSHMSPDEALESGEEVAGELATIFEALLPLYDAAAGV